MKLSEFVSHFSSAFVGMSIPVIFNGIVFRMTVSRLPGRTQYVDDHVLDVQHIPLSNSRTSEIVRAINESEHFYLSPTSRSGYSATFTLYVYSH